ncbi:UbiA family prenyltransferase [Bdellovibrio sp. NC01]|uniref:UbiA family prenyltransferase n=1 Tax=Bdellovibrio sp. NC01 TaxID=2220073 RepID=UPI001159981C|nr:UbiA family prenyltransferase [Bdellovibrio sp. NC01]QDK36603.1 prenyltransferase [Bdellovibrio sp. NC01]
MSELITLSKNSPEFQSYLLGTFATDKRALPIQSLNVNSASETVTFKIVPTKDVVHPSYSVVLAKTLKARSFLLLLVPLFLVLTKNVVDHTIRDPYTGIIATVGLFLAFWSANLRNDFMDHVKGVDRIIDNSGSRAIQNGWMTAMQVKNLSSLLLLLAILCSLPVIFAFPMVAAVIAVSVVVGMWAQFKKQNSFKYQIGGEIALFLLLGPLLTIGYQLSLGGPLDSESFWLGCLWGWGVLYVVHLKNFVNILPSSQAGFKNTVNWLGFDKARRLLAFWWFAFVAMNLAYHYIYAGLYWGFYLTVAVLLASISFVQKLKNISSSVGSELRLVHKYGLSLFLITIGLWVFECLWYLFT